MKQFFNLIFLLIFLIAVNSCSFKNKVVYLDNADKYEKSRVNSGFSKKESIQINDILKIDVTSALVEAASVYNTIKKPLNLSSLQLLQLECYQVNDKYEISFPVLGVINVKNLTLENLRTLIYKKLLDGGFLSDFNVIVKKINNKFTVLREVNKAGTFSHIENNLTVLQALGYAGGVTVNSNKNNVLLIREVDGYRETFNLDLTNLSLLQSEAYHIKNNDVIIVNPNFSKIKSAGFIGSPQSIASFSSLFLSITLLLLNN